ncbi:MAG: hypothetical protein ABW169_13365 [Sphingobium sp.]
MIFHVDPKDVADEGDEHAIQVRLLNRLRMVAPRVKAVAIPNQGNRSIATSMRMRAEGMHKGAWDIEFMWEGGRTAWVELKDRKGTLKPEQIEFGNWLVAHGFPCGVFRSVETVIAFLRDQGAPIMERAA